MTEKESNKPVKAGNVGEEITKKEKVVIKCPGCRMETRREVVREKLMGFIPTCVNCGTPLNVYNEDSGRLICGGFPMTKEMMRTVLPKLKSKELTLEEYQQLVEAAAKQRGAV